MNYKMVPIHALHKSLIYFAEMQVREVEVERCVLSIKAFALLKGWDAVKIYEVPTTSYIAIRQIFHCFLKQCCASLFELSI